MLLTSELYIGYVVHEGDEGMSPAKIWLDAFSVLETLSNLALSHHT